MVILVSVVTTPFAWVHDQVVFLPALVYCFLQWRKGADRLVGKALALLGYLVINTLPFMAATQTMKSLAPEVIVHRLPPGQANQFWLLWMAPAFLAGYVLCRRMFENHTHQIGGDGKNNRSGGIANVPGCSGDVSTP